MRLQKFIIEIESAEELDAWTASEVQASISEGIEMSDGSKVLKVTEVK